MNTLSPILQTIIRDSRADPFFHFPPILPSLNHKPLAKKRFCHLFKSFVLAAEQVDFVIQ